MSIYMPCDIRGQAIGELSPELYQRWGRVLGCRLGVGDKFVVGGDVRDSTPEFLEALVDGLCEAGVDVVDLGQLPTPMIYYAQERLKAAGCAIVTASHNPAKINGLKWALGGDPPTQQDVQELRLAAEGEPGALPNRRPSAPRRVDVTFDYVAWMQETWLEALSTRRHVVLDPMHGSLARRARRYLQAVFPQCLISTIHDDPLPDFAGRSPDCSQPQLLGDLCDAVYRERAHLGIAFDGDGDRLALVDNEGIVLTAEEATLALLHSFGEQLRGQTFVYDLKFSDRLVEAARELGAEPVAERSGHAFIRRRMRQTKALFGAEVSGHYFFGDLGGRDDGLFAAARLLAFLGRTETPLADLRRTCPEVFITPDMRVLVPVEQHRSIIDQVRSTWSEHPQTELDGVRIDFPDGWALVRSSVTEAALTFRLEAADPGWLTELTRRFCDALPGPGDQLWNQFQTLMGPGVA